MMKLYEKIVSGSSLKGTTLRVKLNFLKIPLLITAVKLKMCNQLMLQKHNIRWKLYPCPKQLYPFGFTLRFMCVKAPRMYCTVQNIFGKLPQKHPRLRAIFANVFLGISQNIFRAGIFWNPFGCFWENNRALLPCSKSFPGQPFV